MSATGVEKIKILHVLNVAHLGGTELMTYRLAKSMDAQRFENEVCFLSTRGPISEYFEKSKIRVTHLELKSFTQKLIAAPIRLYQHLKKNRYDIVQFYGLQANLLGRIVGRLAGCENIVGGLRSLYPSDSQNPWTLWLDRLTLPLARCYISNSQAAVDFLITKGYPSAKFKVIYNGIEPERFQSSVGDLALLKDRYGILLKDRLVITCIANLRAVKGHEFLIRALRELKRGRKDFICLIVGDGVLRGDLEKRASDLGLREDVIFLGHQARERIPEILAITDIFVLPSFWEGMPGAVMEAMAQGIPVVATDSGGTPEIVVDGATGYLVPAKDSSALAQKITLLLGDALLRKRMGESGQQRIQEQFSLRQMTEQYEIIYRELIANGNQKIM
jgi:glycosyltransferase involved in cell wall biosynthesis